MSPGWRRSNSCSKGGSTSWHHTNLAKSQLRVFRHLEAWRFGWQQNLDMLGLSAATEFHRHALDKQKLWRRRGLTTLGSDSHQHCIHIQGHHLPKDWVWELSKAIKTFSVEVKSHLIVPEFNFEAFTLQCKHLKHQCVRTDLPECFHAHEGLYVLECSSVATAETEKKGCQKFLVLNL